jgi:hypothetical protein
MDNKIRDEIISKAIGTPSSKSCLVCSTEFVGLRNVCSDKCHHAIQIMAAYNKSLRPIDYTPTRPPLLITDFDILNKTPG